MNGRRVHLLVHGLVQGVAFRASARGEALRLQLQGWVRNLPTGQVEAVAEGEARSVQAFVDWCRHGPPGAQVSTLAVEDAPPLGDLRGFLVTR
jgi:acylphosphatase